MALINKVLPGYTATLWCQDDATPTPLTDTQLATWASVSAIIGSEAGGTGTAGIQVPVEAIPAFGADDAFAAYSVAGARTGAKITTQNQVTSLTITAAWNPADTAQLLIRDDGYNGTIVRTYVVAVYDGLTLLPTPSTAWLAACLGTCLLLLKASSTSPSTRLVAMPTVGPTTLDKTT